MTLGELPNGAIFETLDGIRAVKSEYHMANGQCECILLESGEYAHFPNGNEEEVREVAIPAPLQWTREPVSPGLYWCRSVANNSPATVYEIIGTPRGLRVQAPEGEVDELYNNVEWCGPLPEPK